MVIGLSLLEGGGVSIAVIAAVFLSNLPEAIAATTGLAASGWSRRRSTGSGRGVMLVTAWAAPAGYALFEGASPRTFAFVSALSRAARSS
jgi:ZIP family zinc transporter